MRRRTVVLGMAALAASLGVRAQQSGKVPRVGYLFSFAAPQGEHLWRACREGLRELGYVEGQNIVLEPRFAGGRHERLPALVAELVEAKVDVIVSAATPASLAAKAGAGPIPIVMVAVGDPLAIGLVSSLSHPGGNVTGLTLLTPDLSGKRLQLVLDVLGRAERVAVLVNPENRSHDVFLRETQAAAETLAIRLLEKHARNAGEIEAAFDFSGGPRPEAMIVFDDPVLWGARKEIVAQVRRAKLPAVYGYTEFVEVGGLISLGPDRRDHYRRTARYVDRILKGDRPAALPVERPTKFELVVNARAAREEGLKLSQALLIRADRVIE
jgi:putative tryptophan/tyrosine transport system substrate-binding protein